MRTFAVTLDLTRRPRSLRLLLVMTAWAGALAGAAIALAALAWDGGRQVPAPAASAGAVRFPAELGQRVPTSFGSLSVDTASRLAGRAAATNLPLARGEFALQVAITFINTSDRPVPYSASQVRLVPAAGGAAISAGAGDLGPTELRPLAARRVILRFAVAESGALPRLEIREPGGHASTLVSLGSRRALPVFDHIDHTTGPDGLPLPR